MSQNFSRRGFLKGVGIGAGAALGTRLAGGAHLIGDARADVPEKSALLCIFLPGGYNAIFSSADSFVGTGFGNVDGNQKVLGGDGNLVIDAPTLGTLPDLALQNMSTIGIRHGSSDHGGAQTADWSDGNRSHALRLAAAMGGDASIKAAAIGAMPPGPRPAEGSVSLQLISDMDSTIRALGGGPADPKQPGRNVSAAALARAQTMSGTAINTNPKSGTQFKDGYSTVIDTLQKPIKPFKFSDVAQPYNVTSTAVTNFASKLVAAELMIRAGTNVVTVLDSGGNGDLPWDTHGDSSAQNVRNMMNQRVLPALKTFLTRITTDQTLAAMNIVVTIFGDFARSRPGSDHASSVSATVIGKYVKLGTMGKMDANVGLPATIGAGPQYWGYLANALKVQQPPNPNPYTNLIKTTKGWG